MKSETSGMQSKIDGMSSKLHKKRRTMTEDSEIETVRDEAEGKNGKGTEHY